MATASHIDRRVVLAMLLLVYIFNFLDRQLLSILATPIKADLELTDTQLGMLGGVAFAILYTVMGIPLALLADRTERSWVVAGSLAVWSGFTALCGTATSLLHLFAARVGVGVGEAGGVAPSYALIADYFPLHQRARALAVYSLGAPVGQAAGLILGAVIAQALNWRAAFVIIGVTGLVFAPLFKTIVRDPPREATDERGAGAASAFRILAGKKSFWFISLGAGMNGMVSYALAFWLPSILIRSFGMTLTAASYFSGSLVLIGGSAGVLLGGWLADRSGQVDPGYYPKLAGISWLVSAPLFVLGFLSPSPSLAWLILVVPQALNLVWFGPVVTAVQHLVAPPLRATASACFLLIANLLGLGVGTWLMGGLSDAMSARYGGESLRYAAIISANLALVASIFAFLSVRPLRREWVE
ncbi:MAG TPA: MFS transporter [Novosphingobium sp.]|nr:MFS transporter [Novosphingobium sp.]